VPNISVQAVEEDLISHMNSQALGSPVFPSHPVQGTVNQLTACQGHFVMGEKEATFEDLAAKIVAMVKECDAPIDDQVCAISLKPSGLARADSVVSRPGFFVSTPSDALPSLALDPSLDPTTPTQGNGQAPIRQQDGEKEVDRLRAEMAKLVERLHASERDKEHLRAELARLAVHET
jgi:hypothetical protein